MRKVCIISGNSALYREILHYIWKLSVISGNSVLYWETQYYIGKLSIISGNSVLAGMVVYIGLMTSACVHAFFLNVYMHVLPACACVYVRACVRVCVHACWF